MALEREQEDLFMEMAEATLAAPRDQREWLLIPLMGGARMQGPWGSRTVLETDVEQLHRHRLLQSIRGASNLYSIPPDALNLYGEMKAQRGEPLERVEDEPRRYIESDAFQAAYPQAYAQWADAERRVWAADSEQERTAVGLKAREALQTFATEALARYQPPDADPDVAKVNRRLGAIIAMFLPALGKSRSAHLEALGDLSEATVELAQRQTHGNERPESLTREDARHVVFSVAFVMYELARAFEAAAAED